tara:strand:- start:134 stop:526 length:393 start_codon:yes stop_codon:yes gene_type:complete
MGTSDIYFRIAGTHTGVGTSEETTLQFPQAAGGSKTEIWILVSFHYVRSDGTAANYAPSLGQAASFGSGINKRLGYSATAVGTPINDVFATPIPCLTDSSGRLYFTPGFVGVSTDNDGDYEFWFQKVRGS